MEKIIVDKINKVCWTVAEFMTGIIYILVKCAIVIPLAVLTGVLLVPGLLFAFTVGGARRVIGMTREEFYGTRITKFLNKYGM